MQFMTLCSTRLRPRALTTAKREVCDGNRIAGHNVFVRYYLQVSGRLSAWTIVAGH